MSGLWLFALIAVRQGFFRWAGTHPGGTRPPRPRPSGTHRPAGTHRPVRGD